MKDLTHFRIFLAVAEMRSFAAAARRLGLTPASVTRAVAGLEDTLGVQLLLRTTRRVSLTAAGALYASEVRPMVAGLDAAAQAVREEAGITSGLLRISAPMSMGLRLLPDVVSQFRILHPQVRIALNLDDRLVDILSEPYDLAIRISAPARDKSTIWRKLCAVPRGLYASPRYLARRGRPATPEDLGGHVCLAHASDGRGESWTLTKGDTTRSVQAGADFGANSGELLRTLIMRDEGIALLPRFLVQDAVGSGTLAPVLPDWRPQALWLTLYYPPYERIPARVRTFADFFEVHVTQTRPLD